jgi:hypothetical protein
MAIPASEPLFVVTELNSTEEALVRGGKCSMVSKFVTRH